MMRAARAFLCIPLQLNSGVRPRIGIGFTTASDGCAAHVGRSLARIGAGE
jgi:hypothetical protein